LARQLINFPYIIFSPILPHTIYRFVGKEEGWQRLPWLLTSIEDNYFTEAQDEVSSTFTYQVVNLLQLLIC